VDQEARPGTARRSAVRLSRATGLHRVDGGWTDDDGRAVDDAETLERLRTLVLPPAWTDVWASPDPLSRVQATGVDTRGRTQYRYSTVATATAAEDKFAHVLDFAVRLPALRARVAADLAATDAHPVRRVTATVVRLLDRGLFRVGNSRYARDNHTYGLTTLVREQVSVQGGVLTFTFTGKEHRPWRTEIEDPEAAAVVEELLRGPGASAVFTAGAHHEITSTVVNAYIHGAVDAGASAKTFRTWGGTAAAAAIVGGATAAFAPQSRRADLAPLDVAAHLLGNTRAVARDSYVHPLALEAGGSPAVRAAIAAATRTTRSSDVRVVLGADPAVEAIAGELRRLSA
jgi:DNA topoisomerase-1